MDPHDLYYYPELSEDEIFNKRVMTDKGHWKIRLPNHPHQSAGRGYVYEHTLIAEKILNKSLPPNAVIHHHTPDQLVICQNQAYHVLLHRRTKALRECGHANWRRCTFCKTYSPLHELTVTKKGTVYHKICNALHQSERRKHLANNSLPQ